ncbi:MAG TPA: hypothetical protein P5277_01460 [Candidatus Paceibacterota bacterium]|nr:hypothetical protein [Candidatus Paceibacterota bacterium]
MKKAILFDDESCNKSLELYYLNDLKDYDYATRLIRNLKDCLKILKTEQIGVVIIHHLDFKQVDVMREVSPDTKYIGYSSNVSFYHKIGTIGYEFNETMEAYYDGVIGLGSKKPLSLFELLNEINKFSDLDEPIFREEI